MKGIHLKGENNEEHTIVRDKTYCLQLQLNRFHYFISALSFWNGFTLRPVVEEYTQKFSCKKVLVSLKDNTTQTCTQMTTEHITHVTLYKESYYVQTVCYRCHIGSSSSSSVFQAGFLLINIYIQVITKK